MEKYTVTEIMNFDDKEELVARYEAKMNIRRMTIAFLTQEGGQEEARNRLYSDPRYIKLTDEEAFLDAIITLKTIGAIYHNDVTGEWVIKEEF